ncbi:P-loop containing nucleoside triphosphate hydrolase protein [Roridomyces roridus]|uniref:P-loop containing nucleoside triphosphate hydrolase protein n=1 Tax=Roridomyces roridus TaxID=1738132 RepID=A0AAD7CFX6_9AGAR|nr:P-loop containing nucleoside triphosphate hydrolase protein [Roridomyces roridus]
MSAVKPLLDHVLHALSPTRPLFLAVQGPQGSGKSYLSALLVNELRSRELQVALFSLDDIYLPHADLVSLSETHPDNSLWRGRGQPGTHDISLGLQVLSQLKDGKPVEIPRFDKSLFGGEGDRVPPGSEGAVKVTGPVDVVIFEGWCVGFYPISSTELDSRWDGAWAKERVRLGIAEFVSKEDVIQVNEALKNYIPLWNFFDTFAQLEPCSPNEDRSPLSVIYTWRLQQEHHMKAQNGGKGMTDAGVKAFVDRYMPGYVFFGDGPKIGFDSQQPRWIGKSLRITIDDSRIVVRTEPL